MGFLYIILATILFSFVTVGQKKLLTKRNEYVTLWGITLCSIPLFLILNIYFGLPEISSNFWLFLGINVVLNFFAQILLYKALKLSDISLIIPLLSFTPVFLLFTSWIILGEFPTLLGLVGILIIVFGTWLLNISEIKKGIFAPFKAILTNKGSLFALFVAIIWSITSNVDKLALQESSPLFFISCFSLSLAVLFSFIVFIKFRDRIKPEFFSSFWQFLLIGSTWAMAIWLQMLAISKILVPYVISIKRTHSILTVIWGKIFFKEKNIKSRLIGAIVMALGAIMIVVFG